MKYIGEGIKQLPKNIQNLELNLYWNELGENTDNLKYLSEKMTNIPE